MLFLFLVQQAKNQNMGIPVTSIYIGSSLVAGDGNNTANLPLPSNQEGPRSNMSAAKQTAQHTQSQPQQQPPMTEQQHHQEVYTPTMIPIMLFNSGTATNSMPEDNASNNDFEVVSEDPNQPTTTNDEYLGTEEVNDDESNDTNDEMAW